ncbi:hypothetical protein C9374_004819 [Naegleria lovaniensis]|uniref:Uncharacterized protein n=1 Tax=Naegleria lovaniensis TaxID=51637 RepID=A0AA88GR83_NAELO|nr:uncharacterized protein C9374_004819 [Naegleria lovaniensis]KAG2382852.1 hypothetical protein C9374_004819 [Naegleria lovaniensis]
MLPFSPGDPEDTKRHTGKGSHHQTSEMASFMEPLLERRTTTPSTPNPPSSSQFSSSEIDHHHHSYGHSSWKSIPSEVVHFMMEFLDDESLLRVVMPLSRHFEDYSVDLIYRRNIERGYGLLNFIYTYKTIAQITPPPSSLITSTTQSIHSSLETDDENSLFSTEMFDKLYGNTVLKCIDLHDYCNHVCGLIIPLLNQYTRQREEHMRLFATPKKIKKSKLLSPTSSNTDEEPSVVSGTPNGSCITPPTPSPFDNSNPESICNLDLFKVGEKHFRINKSNSQKGLSKCTGIKRLSVSDTEGKKLLFHKRYFQLLTFLNLIISIDYLKTWQSSLMNDLSMFRRISSKKSILLSREARKLEDDAFLFCRELFYCCKRLKALRHVSHYRKKLKALIVQITEIEKPNKHGFWPEEKKAFMMLLSIFDNLRSEHPYSKKLSRKIVDFYNKNLIQTEEGQTRIELYESTTFNIKFFLERCCSNIKKELEKK